MSSNSDRSGVTAAVIGIDVGGTKLLAVRLAASRSAGASPAAGAAGASPAAGAAGADAPSAVDVVVEAELKLPTPADGPELVAEVAEVVERLSIGGEPPAAVGVGAPGLVDRAGILRFAPHLPAAAGTPLIDGLRRQYPGARLWAGNDATAAAWAEHVSGAGTGVDDMVLVTLGTGIGGGLVAGGRLSEGAHGFAGEFGHLVVDPHGPMCPCGKRGCWERFASGSGLGLLGREAAMAGQAPEVVALAGGDPEAVRGEHVTVAAAKGDGPAVEILARFAWWVALGLANLANIFDPALIVLGGGLVEAGEVLLAPTRAAFVDLVEAGIERHGPPIRAAELGARAGAVGAALLASKPP